MKSKKNKRIVITVLILVMIATVGIWVYLGNRRFENEQREAELRMIESAITDRIHYARVMFFDHEFSDISNFINSGDPFRTGALAIDFSLGERQVSDVVFVNSEEEAEGFGEDVLVFWPTEWSEMLLDVINEWLDPDTRALFQGDTVIDITDLNVELPLTWELMVTDWELMAEIWERFGRNNQRSVRRIIETRVNQALRHGNVIVDTDKPTEDTD